MSTLPYDSSSRTDPVPAVAAAGGDQAFEAVVREFESVADEVGMPRPAAEELHELCRQVAEVSRRVFPGDVRIKVGRDWEAPDWIYFVVDVCASGTPDEFVSHVREWDSSLCRTIGGRMRFFCLAF